MDDLRLLVSKRSFFGIITQLIQLLTSFVVGSLIARFLGPQLYGSYNILVSIWVLSTIGGGAITGTVQYFIAKEGKSISAFVIRWFKISLFLTFLGGLVVIVIASLLSKVYGLPIFYFIIVGSSSILITILSFASGVLVGLGELKVRTNLYVAFELLRGLQILFIILFKNRVLGALFGYIVAYSITAVVSLLIIRKYLNSKEKKEPDHKEFKRILSNNYASAVVTSIPTIGVTSIIVGVISLEFSGYFRALTLLASLISIVSTGVVSGVFHLTTSFYHSGDNQRLNSVRKMAAQIVFILSIPIFIFYVVLAPEIITTLYRSAYSPIEGPMILLSFIYLFSALMIPNNLLSSIGSYDLIMYANIIGLIAYILLMFSTHYIGIYGATLAFGANIIANTIIGTYYTIKKMHFVFPYKIAIVAGINSTIIALAIKLISIKIHLQPILFITIVIAGFVLYLILEHILKQINLKMLFLRLTS